MQLFHTETNALGVTRRFYSDDDANITVVAEQDLEPLVERNKRAQVDRGKRITSDYANPIATIPHVWAMHWLNTEGWWVYDADKDEGVEKKLNQKLNDSDYRWLRTSELRV